MQMSNNLSHLRMQLIDPRRPLRLKLVSHFADRIPPCMQGIPMITFPKRGGQTHCFGSKSKAVVGRVSHWAHPPAFTSSGHLGPPTTAPTHRAINGQPHRLQEYDGAPVAKKRRAWPKQFLRAGGREKANLDRQILHTSRTEI